jgi:eukaryotic-like serine/threonine-protein kinase
MGRVVEATHTALGKRVAIKEFHPHLAGKSDSMARFVREGRAIARLRHPHIVEVFDLEQTDDGTPYLVMELLEGCTLAQHLARSVPARLPLADAIDVILPLVSALATAHEAGIVHRDVKPSNIFLRGGHVADPCLVDFGVSRYAGDLAHEELTRSGTIVGSYPYFSPEHTRGAKHVTGQSDLYSLAAVLYECAAGATPFDGESAYELMHMIATKDVPPPSLVVPSLPRELDEIIGRAMDRDPRRRYPTMRAFGSALLGLASRRTWHVWSKELVAGERDRASLERTAEEEAPELPTVPEPRAAAPARRRSPALVLALGGALAGAATLFVLRAGHATGLASPSSQRAEDAAVSPEAPAVVAPPVTASPASAEVPPPPASTPSALVVTPRPTIRPAAAGHAQPQRSGTAPAPERGSNGVPILD